MVEDIIRNITRVLWMILDVHLVSIRHLVVLTDPKCCVKRNNRPPCESRVLF